MTVDLQLQGLVGPTHNYAGLGLGNRASAAHASQEANPRLAALQSLGLIRELLQRDIPVALLLPQPRPRLDVLKALGFHGSVSELLQQAHTASPALLRAVWSSSFMWAANAATVTPGCDSADAMLHVTPANLLSSLHRTLEKNGSFEQLSRLFNGLDRATVHPPLNVTTRLADEGAANHMRLCGDAPGEVLHLFIYGAAPPDSRFPARFMPRQQRAACEAVAEQHQLSAAQCRFIQQHTQAIDAGVFHNDVIAMSHRNLLIVHEMTWLEQEAQLAALASDAPWLQVRVIRSSELSLEDAVKSYFFNAQLVSLPEGEVCIIFPHECAENAKIRRLAESLAEDLPQIGEIQFQDVRESMKNGGGPACLRLRVPLATAAEAEAIPTRLDVDRVQEIERFVQARYRDRVRPDDLLDTAFAAEALQVQQDLQGLLLPGD